ncbi:MAG: HAD-IB family hydrolase [Candidatus Moranbacteria bacterium]|nr:HAD-IB family hydrolase [Candidatus Moranbacteria bacterium]
MKNKTKIAVFDIDGTIFRSNLQFELLSGLAYKGIFSKKTRDKIIKSYRNWLHNKSTYEDYKNELISRYRKEIKGKNKDDVVKVAQNVIAFYHARQFIYTKNLIQELRKDHFMVAISGSPVEIVKEYNQYLKFDDVFGTVYEIGHDKVYTGKEIYVPVQNKADALKIYVAEKGISLTDSLAVGDSSADIAMLELVDYPIAFNSDEILYNYARKKKWKIVVERKDVIYKL